MGEPILFTDTSTPGSGAIVTRTWAWGDSTPDGSGATATHTYTAPGSYTMKLTIVDGGGSTGSTSVPVTIHDCTVPVPDFEGSACEGRPATFTDTTPAGPHPYVWSRWSWGYGPTTTLDPYATTATHTYASSGSYMLTLTVRNSLGIEGSTSRMIAVCDVICPAIDEPALVTAYEGQRILVPMRATDPNGPVLRFTMGPLAGGTFTAPPAAGDGPLAVDGVLDWTPNPGTLGTVTAKFTADDTFCVTELEVTFRVGLAPMADSDSDGVRDSADNCPRIINRGQEDADRDGVGDACAPTAVTSDPEPPRPRPPPLPGDFDADGVADTADNCPADPNPGQADLDGDLDGDACDLDQDGDGVAESSPLRAAHVDNCPVTPNADQGDQDGDGAGDACDVLPEDPDRPVAASGPERLQPPSSGRTWFWVAAASFVATAGALALLLFLSGRRRRKVEPRSAKSP